MQLLRRAERAWPGSTQPWRSLLKRGRPLAAAAQCRLAHTRGRSKWEARLSKLDSLFITGVTRFHEITGYSEIERLKTEVLRLEARIGVARETVRTTRDAYNQTLANRASSQREMNELLLRKQTWHAGDLERFTELYKDDHNIEQNVNEAKAAYDAAEARLEDLQMQNGRLIGARYREEQLWSDKIRQASTWGTWILMGINILLFVVVQLVLEPWKRRKLVRSFERQVRDMFDKTETAVQEGEMRIADVGDELIEAAKPPPLSWDTLSQRLLQAELVLRPVEAGALAGAGAIVAVATGLCIGALLK